MTTHYSHAQSPALLVQWAMVAAANLKAFAQNNNVVPLLVYRGMSGVATATALSIEASRIGLEVGMVYVRKDNEQSHGVQVEHHLASWDMPLAPVFVDDFLDTGATLRACRTQVENAGIVAKDALWYTLLHKNNGTEVNLYY